MIRRDEEHKSNSARRAAAAVLLLSIALIMAFSPGYIAAMFARENYSDWMQIRSEPKVCIINIWHIVGFKPYIGSLGAWLKARANEFKCRYIGIYFNVKSVSTDEARQMIGRGILPDIISFAGGSMEPEMLLQLDEEAFSIDGCCFESGKHSGSLFALPYCASGTLLVYEPNGTAGMSVGEIADSVGSIDDFKRGKALSCICDVKSAGDLYRASITGEAPYFEAVPYKTTEESSGLVQYIGIRRGTDESKLPYAADFLEYITGKEIQSTLGELGLLPVNTMSAPVYDQKWLSELYSEFDPYSLGCGFDNSDE